MLITYKFAGKRIEKLVFRLKMILIGNSIAIVWNAWIYPHLSLSIELWPTGRERVRERERKRCNEWDTNTVQRSRWSSFEPPNLNVAVDKWQITMITLNLVLGKLPIARNLISSNKIVELDKAHDWGIYICIMKLDTSCQFQYRFKMQRRMFNWNGLKMVGNFALSFTDAYSVVC